MEGIYKDMGEEINKEFIMEGNGEWRMGEDEIRYRVHIKYIQCKRAWKWSTFK